MEFKDLIQIRRSVRKFDAARPVPADVLARILEAARIAPSAANKQPWHFIVVRDPRQREALKAAYDRDWFWTAPVILAGCAEPAKAWVRGDGQNYAMVDLSIAFEHMILAAANEGLGACWIGAFDEAKARAVLGVPDDVRVWAMMPLGYPTGDAGIRPFVRKEMNEILHQERW